MFPGVYQAVFGHAAQSPISFVFLEDSQRLGANENVYRLCIGLIAQASQYGVQILECLQVIAKQGFGRSRAPFVLLSVAQYIPSNGYKKLWEVDVGWLQWPTPFEPFRLLHSDLPYTDAQPVRVFYHSPMCLKEGGQWLLQSPQMLHLCKAVFRRLLLAANESGQDAGIDLSIRSRLLDLAKHVSVICADVQVCSFSRISASNKQTMTVRGVSGVVEYSPIQPVLLNLLEVGSLIGAGAKTSFGCGAFSVQIISNNSR